MPPTPADSRIFGFFDFSENVDFLNFPVGFGVWEGLQWIGNGCGLQMDGFSAREVEYGSKFSGQLMAKFSGQSGRLGPLDF